MEIWTEEHPMTLEEWKRLLKLMRQRKPRDLVSIQTESGPPFYSHKLWRKEEKPDGTK